MLFAVTGLLGSFVEAKDGRVGAVKNFLFDDQSWKIRWMVVETGHWLSDRKILIHPSAIARLDLGGPPEANLPMVSVAATPTVVVQLTKHEIESSPEAREDEPVSEQMQAELYEHYGWDAFWGGTYFGPDAIDPISKPIIAETEARPAAAIRSNPGEGDPHLRSVVEARSYHVHATDGDIGHVENFLADDVNWDIRYLVVATHNWWPGEHVQLAPHAVRSIDWAERRINVNVSRDQVRSSPPWDPLALADQIAQERYHRHFGWPGYGW